MVVVARLYRRTVLHSTEHRGRSRSGSRDLSTNRSVNSKLHKGAETCSAPRPTQIKGKRGEF